jgi:hypothetical protein
MSETLIGWIYSVAALAGAGVLVTICSMHGHQSIPASLVIAGALLLNAAIWLRRAPVPVQPGQRLARSKRSSGRIRVTRTLMDPPVGTAARTKIHVH